MTAMHPIIPEFLLNRATEDLLSRGIRIFQGARIAPTDEDHVAGLLDIMKPPANAIIADIGCGVGEVARLLTCLRPDLRFWMINDNRLQLSHVKTGMPFRADMHDIPLRSGCCDGAIFCYSLCHSDFELALLEAARLTKRGGFLFVYDYERIVGDNQLFVDRLCSRALRRTDMTDIAVRAGWEVESWENPKTDDTMFRDAYRNDVEYDLIFNDLRVCAWRAIRT